MFSDEVVDRKLHLFAKAFKWWPQPHNLQELDEWADRLAPVFTSDATGNIYQTRPLDMHEQDFIANERALCVASCFYFLTRYYWIKAKNQVLRFRFRQGQRILWKMLCWLDEQGFSKQLQILKARQLGVCLHPKTPVLTADLRWLPIEDVKPGDELVAVDENVPAIRQGHSRKMRTAIVESRREVCDAAIRIMLDDNRELIATPDHRFLCKLRASTSYEWRKVKDIRIGDEIRSACHPWDGRSSEDGWMAGMLDGEGSLNVKKGGGVSVAIAQVGGTVYRNVKEYLASRRYHVREESDQRKAGSSSKLGGQIVYKAVVNRMDELFRLLGQTRPFRFIDRRWWEGKEMPGKKVGGATAKIVSLELLPAQRMIDLQTSTKTFIANGLVSHNSTLAEGIMLWMCLFVPGSAEQIGSADGQKTQAMLQMLLFAKDRISDLYPWLPPDETRSKRASDRPIISFEKIGTTIIVQHGAMRGGMGQGSTPTGVHLSECSQYVNPVKQIDEGLLKALHASPELVVMLESTGDASHRSAWWWKRKWEWNRDHYWKGEARMLPVFLPWHTTPELYPGEWIHEHPVPFDFQPHADTIAHVQRCEAYVRCTPMLAKILGEQWTMPREQQWFWQFNYDEAKGQRVEKSWIRQMPGDDYEALLGEREKVVGEGTIEVMRSSKMDVPKIPVYMLVGDGVPEKHEPAESEVWYGEDSPARLKCSWTNKGNQRFDWMWVPLAPILEEKFDPLGKCLIFEEPKAGFDYSMGCDTGTGVGGDRSILNITRVGNDAEPDVQVAEYSSDTVSLDDIYIYMSALSALYSKHLTEHPHPKMCIEQRRKFGDRPYSMARFGMGFTRWHMWGQGFDRKIREDHKIGHNARVGWFTNEWSRPMLLGAFLGAVENGWYVVRSKWLAQEIEGMEQRFTDSGKTRMDHEAGEHDDRVFGAAQAYFTMHRHDLIAQRMKIRYDSPKTGGIVIEKGNFGPTIQIPGSKRWQSLNRPRLSS